MEILCKWLKLTENRYLMRAKNVGEMRVSNGSIEI